MRRKSRRVKVIRINHGIMGNPHSRNIERAITKWMKKGYRLDKQQDERGRGCTSWGYTLLTFIEEE